MSLEVGFYRIVFGALVTRMRERQNIKQTDLAERVGVSQPTMSRIELGTHSIDTLVAIQIAETFGVTADELHKRVLSMADRAYAAQRAIAPTCHDSRDLQRKLVDYVVAATA